MSEVLTGEKRGVFFLSVPLYTPLTTSPGLKGKSDIFMNPLRVPAKTAYPPETLSETRRLQAEPGAQRGEGEVPLGQTS